MASNSLSNQQQHQLGSLQQAAAQQAGLGNAFTTGPGFTITNVSNVWSQGSYTPPAPPTKAEQWVFQKSILHAELKEFCKDIVWKSIILACWTNSAYGAATLLCGTKQSAGTMWMIFGLIPLMALAAKKRILDWGERFLG